jgi:hypothetical protein
VVVLIFGTLNGNVTPGAFRLWSADRRFYCIPFTRKIAGYRLLRGAGAQIARKGKREIAGQTAGEPAKRREDARTTTEGKMNQHSKDSIKLAVLAHRLAAVC